MKQQINLYQEQFHEKRVTLPARQMMVVVACLLAGMTVISIAMAWVNHQAAQRHAELSSRTDGIKQANDQLQTKLAVQAVDPGLAAQAADASRQLQARQKIMQWVDKSQENRTILFSALLEGLSRQHVQGLWMSYIAIDNGGQALHLQGSSLAPKNIPDFLSRLNQEAAYKGREFRKVMMRADEINPGILNFALSTDKASKEKLAVLDAELKGMP